ncbi:ribosome silencing factor [Azohydromonas caseinilytica]|uniref:Ribosomal silencing factor RsfS n=1 Tax=Azohydromonas caseinilytica TaxID=2728836 RepID=A0A848F9Q6_9BURK|nr:ribosome silencing factor [Azohydromonas caseinilytica]NML15576.1 ribosome silencing factor [Azohydromonas caseinilytica]
MDIRKLQRAIVDGLEDVKAVNIVVFNTEHLSPLFERVIIASGTSNRQTKALASSVRDTVKARGLQVMRTEGEDNGEWIIVDCGAAVAHIMQPAIRDYYHLEEIWGEKPVKLKLGGAAKSLPKASASDDDVEDVEETAHASRTARTPAGKAALGAVKKTVGTKAPAKKAAAKKTTAAAKKAPAAKRAAPATQAAAPAKKAAAKKAVTRTVGTKTAARKTPVAKAVPDQRVVVNAPAKKAAAKKAPAKKAGAKTAVAAKKAPAAKRAPARKAARA